MQVNKIQLLLKAVNIILRPLVKLLLAHQITYSDIIKQLKLLYVETAEQEFEIDGKPQTDSRISILTGIHRKEVKNIRQQLSALASSDATEVDTHLSAMSALPAQVVATWLGDKTYLNAQGEPRLLPLYASTDQVSDTKASNTNDSNQKVANQKASTEKNNPSFEQLVQQISKGNIRVSPVLTECQHLGLVTLTEEQFVKLNSSAFVPSSHFESKTAFFAENLSAHMQTSCHNMLLSETAPDSAPPEKEQQPLFDRSVAYNNLPLETINAFQALLEQEGMALLKKVNQEAQSAQQAHENRTEEEAHRMTLGLYFHTEQQDEQPSPPETSTPTSSSEEQPK